MAEEIYYKASRYFKERCGKYVQRICIDGGFTCPNRDGSCGTGGCIFCGDKGAGDYLDGRLSVKEQIARRLGENYRGRKRFAAYFQSFSGTYAPVERLRQLYDEALCSELVIALAVATRPDCIDRERAELLAEYKERCDVWVELGLQTSSDKTAELINRGYRSEEFARAARLLDSFGIPVIAHIMIGLPGEGMEELAETVRFVSELPVSGLKLHSVYVMKDTLLEKMYLSGEYTPVTMEEYVRGAVYVLSHVPPGMVIHRLTGDCPPEKLVAPAWNSSKTEVTERILSEMRRQGLRQGSLYAKPEKSEQP